jgi:beta-glucanase (GH16 family)
MKKIVLSLAGIVSMGLAEEKLIFSDDFKTLNFKTWQHESTMNGGGNWEFEWYVNNRTNTYVRDGILYMKPTLTEDMIGPDALRNGDINIWGGSPSEECTGNNFYGCERNGPAQGHVVNPIRSARLRTVNSFNFKYGRVEVKAKLPKGDWLWPAIWMLPTYSEYGPWPSSGEIDIMESRGNGPDYEAGGSNKFASTLHWGPDYWHNRWP